MRNVFFFFLLFLDQQFNHLKFILEENRKYILDFFLLPIRSKDFEYFIEVAMKFLALNPTNQTNQNKNETSTPFKTTSPNKNSSQVIFKK